MPKRLKENDQMNQAPGRINGFCIILRSQVRPQLFLKITRYHANWLFNRDLILEKQRNLWVKGDTLCTSISHYRSKLNSLSRERGSSQQTGHIYGKQAKHNSDQEFYDTYTSTS